MHNNVGNISMVAGIISFVLGVFCAWSPTRGDRLPPIGFSIGITIGGCNQILAQIIGYRVIQRYKVLKERLLQSVDASSHEYNALANERDTCLKIHIFCMAGLFFSACGIPAMMRVVDNQVTFMVIGFSVLQIATFFMARSFYVRK